MGWDVAEIGLNHDLPFDNPLETAKIISERLKANVVIYLDECCLNLTKIEFSGAEDEYILKIFGKDLVSKIFNTNNNVIEYENLEYSLDDCDNENYYDLENFNMNLLISIYKEWIHLDVYVMERWGWWESCFHKKNKIYINKYRKEIFEQAKLFGCNKVAIMSDQGPTAYICSYSESDKIEDLLDYIYTYKYLDDYKLNGKWTWSIDHYLHINIHDFFKSKTKIPETKAISVMFDDFRDLMQKVSD